MVVGCLGFDPFQPPPSAFERWNKLGFTEFDIKLAMLECGYPSPYGERGGNIVDAVVSSNDAVLMHLCMKGDGFYYEDGRGDICDGWHEVPQACHVATPVPVRNVDRRLNSPFCQRFPDADLCR